MATDPNKYKKNADIRPDTLVQTLTSVGSMILMLIGIIGLALELFKEEGWLKTALSWLFESATHCIKSFDSPRPGKKAMITFVDVTGQHNGLGRAIGSLRGRRELGTGGWEATPGASLIAIHRAS